jgi:hypothetical protein
MLWDFIRNYINVEILTAQIENMPNLMNKVHQNSCNQHHKKRTTCINTGYKQTLFHFKQNLLPAIKNLKKKVVQTFSKALLTGVQ